MRQSNINFKFNTNNMPQVINNNYALLKAKSKLKDVHDLSITNKESNS